MDEKKCLCEQCETIEVCLCSACDHTKICDAHSCKFQTAEYYESVRETKSLFKVI